MPLRSRLLSGDKKLEACLVSDPAHVTPNARGPHVTKIQTALFIADEASVASRELQSQTYGPSTTDAVLAFKQKRNIINRAYQTQADNIVGKRTIAALDAEVLLQELRGPLPKGNERPPQFT
jgi:peptidoglycan hydrolase-like protein with peptidoglycan-binding domain